MIKQPPEADVNSKHRDHKFVPALRFRWLTPFYDKVVALTSQEDLFKDLLLKQANLSDGYTVLDVGCGSGTFVIRIAGHNSNLEIHALDADNDILEVAQSKSHDKGAEIHFKQGYSAELPYPDDYFDRVFCSLMFHHLDFDDKMKTLEEIYRVLKPGGEFHFADWGKPQTPLRRASFFLVRLFDGMENTRDCLTDRIPNKMSHLGFTVSETARVAALLGDIFLLKVQKPVIGRTSVVN